jgi:predicted SprT family Zn-dependent metalloprotease
MLKESITEKIKELDQIVTSKWGSKCVPEFDIDYSKTSCTWLGQVVTQVNKKSTMYLQKHLLEAFGQKYIDEIVVHEYAHIVVNNLFPTRMNKSTLRRVTSHGREFKAVCSWLGIVGKSTSTIALGSEHLMKSTRKSTKVISAKCSCTTHKITKNRATKMQNGRGYRCGLCKTSLVLV